MVACSRPWLRRVRSTGSRGSRDCMGGGGDRIDNQGDIVTSIYTCPNLSRPYVCRDRASALSNEYTPLNPLPPELWRIFVGAGFKPAPTRGEWDRPGPPEADCPYVASRLPSHAG